MLQIPPTYIATSHKLHLYGLEIAQNRSNPPYSTIWHYMAHFGPFQTSNMAVIRPSGGHNSLKMPQTHPKVLQILPTGIATSHMLYPYGLEIAQNRSKPLYGTIWHILGLSGRVIWPLSGPVGDITASKCLEHTQKCSRYHLRALLPVTCCIHTAWKSLKIAQMA